MFGLRFATGHGHNSAKAVVPGLAGHAPDTVDPGRPPVGAATRITVRGCTDRQESTSDCHARASSLSGNL
ncbi:serine dehydratase beta chain [Actinosynnema sp. NPDC047251]|uniref:serine dehydratase beta chain n=1 Tax=Saccharothrix espanaensis TaxID=103731 RepID=UPI0018D3E21D